MAENPTPKNDSEVAYPPSYYSSLVKGLVHKLNNQLTVLTGNIGLLLMDGKLSKEVTAALEQMTGTLEQVSVYLDEASLAAKTTPVRFEEVNLHDLVQNLDRPLQLQLVWDQTDPALVVQADRAKLKRALEDLLLNAQLAGAKRISVSLRRDGNNIELALTDNGAGVRPEVLARAFEPFYTTRPKEKALGLGLFRARGELNRMNADLTIESDGSSYTTARIRFTKPPFRD